MYKPWFKFVLMDDADTGGGGAPAPAPTAPAATAPATTPVAAPANTPAATPPTTPDSLLGEKPAETPKPAEGAQAAEAAKPVEYTDFKLPDGVTVDAAKITEFKTIAAELGIPQEGAQKIVDMYAKELKQISDAPLNAWNDLQTKWRDEVKNDPVIGGANLEKNLATTKAGLTNLLGEEAAKFFQALNITGAGNNPDIVRGLIKAAAPHAPATPVNGGPGGSSGKTAGATLYPTMAGLGNGHKD